MRDYKSIFVGGTGRSGTTILTELLGSHPEIYSLPVETRFIIDPDGIMDLASNLSSLYNPNRADVALFRFERLMLDYLTRPKEDPYRSLDFPSIFGEDFYYKTIQKFLDELYYNSFYGWDYSSVPSLTWKSRDILYWLPRIFILNRFPRIFKFRYEKEKISNPKKFSENEIFTKCANLVDSLFMKVTRNHGKSIWCEKTPANILHIEFLYKLFPNTKFIHVKRDPREVVCSLMTRTWAPNDVESASLFLKTILEQILEVQHRFIPPKNSYLEVKLEDLVINTDETFKTLSDFLGLDNNFYKIQKLDYTRVGYWRNKLDDDQINKCEDILGELIPRFGYELCTDYE